MGNTRILSNITHYRHEEGYLVVFDEKEGELNLERYVKSEDKNSRCEIKLTDAKGEARTLGNISSVFCDGRGYLMVLDDDEGYFCLDR